MNSSVYRDNLGRLAALLRARPRPPLEDALWLLELVGRTGGAQHLKLASRQLGLLQYYSLDTAALLALALALVVCTIYIIVTRLHFSKVKLE